MSIRILVADSHELFLKAIQVLLEKENDIEIVDVTNDGYECLNLLSKKKPDILIINNQLNSISGFDVIKIIRNQNINVKYIGLTEYKNKSEIYEMYQLNFKGILSKECSYSELLDSLNEVYNNSTYIDSRMTDIIKEKVIQSEKSFLISNKLTNRENEILLLLKLGKSNKETADILNISERTVKNHLYSIYRKLNVNDRTQAVIYAMNNEI